MNATITNYVPAPKSIELHLTGSPEFSRYSKKVKAIGGSYSACRGHSHTRFVHLPLDEAGRSLANKLIAEFGRGRNPHARGDSGTVVVVRGIPRDFRGKHVHAPVVVHYIDKAESDPCGKLLELYEDAFLRAFPEATEPEPVVEAKPVDEDSLPVSITLTRGQARVILAALERRVHELDSLGGQEASDLCSETRSVYQCVDGQVFSAY